MKGFRDGCEEMLDRDRLGYEMLCILTMLRRDTREFFPKHKVFFPCGYRSNNQLPILGRETL